MNRKLVVLTASWCTACPGVKKVAELVTRDAGIPLEIIDIEEFPEYGVGITQLPTVQLRIDDQIAAQDSGLLRRDTIQHLIGV